MLLFRGKEANARSFVKALSWRTLGSIDTFVLSYFFSGNASIAGKIAGTEVITKILLYFFHERVWAQIGWGFRRREEPASVAEISPAGPGASEDEPR